MHGAAFSRDYRRCADKTDLRYMLRGPVFLPPMNLSLAELEALHQGRAIVAEAADKELQTASLTKKIDNVATANSTIPRN